MPLTKLKSISKHVGMGATRCKDVKPKPKRNTGIRNIMTHAYVALNQDMVDWLYGLYPDATSVSEAAHRFMRDTYKMYLEIDGAINDL